MNVRQQAFKDRGLCIFCGGKSRGVNRNTRAPYISCNTCNDKSSERLRQRQRALRQRGVCIACGKKESRGMNSDTQKPYAYCETCNDDNNVQTQERHKRYKRDCRCRHCGNPVTDISYISCASCRARHRDRQTFL